MAAPLYLGIDLGTTNSTAAAFDGEKLTLIRNAQGANLTPSVVRIDARGAVTVGERARRLIDSDPQNTRSEFKRLMGTAQALEFASAKLSRLRGSERAPLHLGAWLFNEREERAIANGMFRWLLEESRKVGSDEDRHRYQNNVGRGP